MAATPGQISSEPTGQTSRPDRRLNVLVLDEEIPFPLNSGKRIRTWNLLRHLGTRHTITFVCYGSPEDPRRHALESLGLHVILVSELPPSDSMRFYAGALTNLASTWPYSVSRHHTHRFSQAVRQLIASERFDLVHLEWTPYASYLDAIGNLPTLIMAHNIETTVWQRRSQHASHSLERSYMSLQASKMARFERRSFQRTTRVAVVSSQEQQIAIEWGARATSVVPNGVDTEALMPMPEAAERDSLLFLGSLDWQPNRDALLYLLQQILPEIQAQHPGATLRVVGRQPATKLREQVEGHQGVEWVGEVPDIRPFFARAAVVLVPLRVGGGSRIKILESLSMEKAVVTTEVGAEGLNVISGRHCLIASGPREFARSVVDLLNAPERAAEMGRNGRNLVVSQYDWSQIAESLDRAWIETAEDGCTSHKPA